MIKNKKQMFIVIGLFTLLLFLGGTTYAWFTYRRETGDQELVAGEIYLHLNEGQEEIEMSNVFPETAAEARSRNDNFITFTVDGKNTSNKTIYYEIILDHGADKASPKTRYRDEDLRFDLVALDSNGDEDEYLLSAVSYETITNRRIYVDTVDASTTTELERGYKLRMWLDENIVISDTAQDAVYNTTEYKNKYATVKLIVSGDFQEKEASKSLYTIMRETAVMDNINSDYVDNTTPGINFGAISSDTNGKGVYMRAGTENNAYPIMYYRGAVEDNNVMFAGQCWKAVRTTDTGGVKLIYNGETGNVYEKVALSLDQYTIVTNTDGTNTNVWTFDSTDNSWNASTTANLELSFKVPAGDGYIFEMTGQNGSSGSGGYTIYKGTSSVNGEGGGGDALFALNHPYGTLTADDVVKFTFSGGGFTTPSTFKIKMIGSGDLITANGCDNTGASTQITLSGTNTFPFSGTNLYNSPAYNGYMYGTVYAYSSSNWTSGARFGSSFTWDGTNYKLVDATVTTPNATHHYSCNTTDAEATCTDLRYVYYGTSTKYYITLTGGDGVEEAIVKMQTNTNDSNAKDKIETWYASNMNTVTNKLEDTIWCNDRSFGNGNNNGWIANGGDLLTNLYYGAYQRSAYASNSSTVKNQPSLACASKNDSFTWKNGNGNQKLQYPVAMITEDEMVLAGGVAGQTNGTFYLTTGQTYWSLSPDSFSVSSAGGFSLGYNGYLDYYSGVNSYGLRPAVSLKSSTQVVSGTGTVADPYVIE